VMMFAFWMYSFATSLMRLRTIILTREAESTWVRELLTAEKRT